MARRSARKCDHPTFVVVFDVESVGRRVVRETIGEAATFWYLTDVPARSGPLAASADVILAQNTAKIWPQTNSRHSDGKTVAILYGWRRFYPYRACRRSADRHQRGGIRGTRWRSMRSP